MADAKSPFLFNEIMSHFDFLIGKASSQEEIENLIKFKQKIISQQESMERQALDDLLKRNKV